MHSRRALRIPSRTAKPKASSTVNSPEVRDDSPQIDPSSDQLESVCDLGGMQRQSQELQQQRRLDCPYAIHFAEHNADAGSHIAAVNGTLSLIATVTNDSGNGGVTWSASCGTNTIGGCGTFGADQSASSAAVTYTAPATVPPATVIITATVTDDTNIIAKTAAITISAASAPIAVTLSSTPASLVVNSTLAACG